MTVLGSGPGHGTAAFTAAKLVEAAGLAATSQDLEEWEHGDAHARLADLPIVVIAPPGRTLDHSMAAHARVVCPSPAA
ncbi:hypothetical protein LDL08_35090 [Nonomuraea glycinis]|uniref:SIS domain-containing protein n=1 Tax=Nonomuraea glycinis TaxID=2047744 RepID=A0A918E9Z7_9ACTN|nr:hypothetical protein [Nonomuraea glycinis]MCA2181405.1 hypothetical protein [Nonomuraea glycinis]GGP14402.1 hypothetical protein GCM10012278_70060 [Nonomuraea glycinis]